MTACMGGWCLRREGCPHYTSTSKATPAESLCAPGQDGVLREAPQHERTLRELIEEATCA